MKQVLWAAAWAAAAVARADTIRVPEDVGSVQEAIDMAAEGDIVDIGHGVFAGGLSLRGKAITLRGRDGAEFTSLIGGDGVVRCVKNEGPDTVIEGLTIGGGELENEQTNMAASPFPGHLNSKQCLQNGLNSKGDTW
mgnify:CR=1 FL=1